MMMMFMLSLHTQHTRKIAWAVGELRALDWKEHKAEISNLFVDRFDDITLRELTYVHNDLAQIPMTNIWMSFSFE